MYAIYLGHPGLLIDEGQLNRATEARKDLLERLRALRRFRFKKGDKHDLSGEECPGAATNPESFMRQAQLEDEDKCQHDKPRNGGVLRPGDDVSFRIFPGIKKGANGKKELSWVEGKR